jgi:predicted CXXCH cytochrome family protein
VHAPLKKGECTACHSPHGSKITGQLYRPLKGLCLSCHENLIKIEGSTQPFIHKPIEEGKCDHCHQAHYSQIRHLLLNSGAEICADCHALDDKALRGKHLNRALNNVDCINCHTPHSADSKTLFRSVLHKPFSEGRCKDCHES